MFYAKVINDEGERDGVSVIVPGGYGVFDGVIAVCGWVSDEASVCDLATLFEAWYVFSYFKMCMPVVRQCEEIILLNDLLEYE